MVILAADFQEMTNNSPHAVDTKFYLENTGSSGIVHLSNGVHEDVINAHTFPAYRCFLILFVFAYQLVSFANATAHIADNKARGIFYLFSCANGQPEESIPLAAELYFTPFKTVETRTKCANTYNIPDMKNWYLVPLHSSLTGLTVVCVFC